LQEHESCCGEREDDSAILTKTPRMKKGKRVGRRETTPILGVTRQVHHYASLLSRNAPQQYTTKLLLFSVSTIDGVGVLKAVAMLLTVSHPFLILCRPIHRQ
jgi:hypothetical protein